MTASTAPSCARAGVRASARAVLLAAAVLGALTASGALAPAASAAELVSTATELVSTDTDTDTGPASTGIEPERVRPDVPETAQAPLRAAPWTVAHGRKLR